MEIRWLIISKNFFFYTIRPVLILASLWEAFNQLYTPSRHKTEVVFSKNKKCLRKKFALFSLVFVATVKRCDCT